MMNFLISLIIASMVGTILWIIQNVFKPVTQKLFSESWHYYTSLTPVFFFLGGTKVINVMVESVLTSRCVGLIQQSEKLAGEMFYLANVVRNSENIREIMLWTILIWVAGVIIFLTVNIKEYVRFKYFVLQNYRVYNTDQSPSKVIISDNAVTPMVVGFLNPMVVLPDVQFKEKELSMILAHEFVHIKRGDLLIKLIVMIAKSVHWFNPLIYLLSKQINDYCELSCDEKVVQKMDVESRRSYGEMILSVLDYGVKKRSSIYGDYVINLCNSKNNIKRRLLNIMKVKKIKKTMIALSVSATVLLIGIGAYAAYGYESQVPERIKFYTEDYDDTDVKEKVSNTADELTLEVDVPYRIKYQDPYADPPLDIDIQPGKQVLKGVESEVYRKIRRSN